jgi:hypothetical protein
MSVARETESFRSAWLSHPFSLTGMKPRASILEMRVKGQVFSLLCLDCEFAAISRGPGVHGQHHDSANEPA